MAVGKFLIVVPHLLIANLFLVYVVFCLPREGRIFALHPGIKRPVNLTAAALVALVLLCAGVPIIVAGAVLDAHSKKFHAWLDKAVA